MADKIVPQGAMEPRYKSMDPARCISGARDLLGVSSAVDMKLAHLSAMLQMTWGDESSLLHRSNDGIRDHFMWACSQIADECIELRSQESDARQAEWAMQQIRTAA